MGLQNEFETAVVNESSVFEPLKDYSIRQFSDINNRHSSFICDVIKAFIEAILMKTHNIPFWI